MLKKFFWAKTLDDGRPGISVVQHACYARLVCRCLCPLFFPGFPGAEFEKFICFLAAVHDVGKISPQFQAKNAVWLEENGLAREARVNAWKKTGFSHA